MPQGEVKRYERNSGFGFIETEQGDLFVHHTALVDREFLLPGQQVEFDREIGDRGPRAVNVRVIGEVSPKRKNRPDWRGHRGGSPRFEDQERVLPGRSHRPPSPTPPRAGRARPQRPAAAPHLGPPRDEEDEAAGIPTSSGSETEAS